MKDILELLAIAKLQKEQSEIVKLALGKNKYPVSMKEAFNKGIKDIKEVWQLRKQ